VLAKGAAKTTGNHPPGASRLPVGSNASNAYKASKASNVSNAANLVTVSRNLTTPYSKQLRASQFSPSLGVPLDLDPESLVLAKPEIPSNKRQCPHCNSRVNRLQGFCPQCGKPFNFTPKLSRGDRVNGKLEIRGCVAYGGLGWIYLGRDTLLERWVILKGLLNGKDSAGAAAAVAERQYLAAVKHSSIVAIYDFIEHEGAGYIVMEYVGGLTVDSIRAAHDTVRVPTDATGAATGASFRESKRHLLGRSPVGGPLAIGRKGVLPVEEAIAYVMAILPAFAYLHENKLVYCDFKPDNFMVEQGNLKLIDLGGVRRIGDPDGDIYGSRGFTAPEAEIEPVAASDIFSIGRTLAVLIMDFDYLRSYEHALPTPQEQPILAQHDLLYRFLLKATHLDPAARFYSADEMRRQLQGVLREIVAGTPAALPWESEIFWSDELQDSEDRAGAEQPLPRLLPVLKIDAIDPASREIIQLCGSTGKQLSESLLRGLITKYGDQSSELAFRWLDQLIAQGQYAQFDQQINLLTSRFGDDWRIHWYTGKRALAEQQWQRARDEFERVYCALPGELAPKLALAFAAERLGHAADALQYYRRVARTDPNHTSACFGWARCASRLKDDAQLRTALELVPASHSLSTQARIALAGSLMGDGIQSDNLQLEQAATVLQTITVNTGLVHQLRAMMYAAAARLIGTGTKFNTAGKTLLGAAWQGKDLRLRAELEYRKAATFAATPLEKFQWVDLANSVRPLTLI
jgi:serine/threonine-protein kinase PknG